MLHQESSESRNEMCYYISDQYWNDIMVSKVQQYKESFILIAQAFLFWKTTVIFIWVQQRSRTSSVSPITGNRPALITTAICFHLFLPHTSHTHKDREREEREERVRSQQFWSNAIFQKRWDFFVFEADEISLDFWITKYSIISPQAILTVVLIKQPPMQCVYS